MPAVLNNSYFNELKNQVEKNSYEFQIKKELEQNIEQVLQATRSLYWSTIEAKEKNINISDGYLSVLEFGTKYIELSQKNLPPFLLRNNASYNFSSHNMYKSLRKIGAYMGRMFAGLPLVEFESVRHSWKNLIEVRTPKVMFAFLGSLITLIFGALNTANVVFFSMTVIHFLTRLMANRYKGQDNYLRMWQNIQLFIWPYIWLAIGKLISYIITINILPEGTLIGLVTAFLIWAELKGVLENAKIANVPIPPIIERIVLGDKCNKDVFPPL